MKCLITCIQSTGRSRIKIRALYHLYPFQRCYNTTTGNSFMSVVSSNPYNKTTTITRSSIRSGVVPSGTVKVLLLPFLLTFSNYNRGFSFLATSTSTTSTTPVVHAMSTSAVPSTSRGIVMNKKVPGLQHGMDYMRLGDSDLIVSKICLGTMTFGQQNTIAEGVEQMRIAVEEYGVNFIDTAEMYPVPTTAETQGQTDRAICEYIKTTNRKDLIIATKVSGRSSRIDWLPRSKPKTLAEVNKQQIIESVTASLERLQCEYIDLLQIHWPDRYTGGLFGQTDFTPTQYEEAPAPNSFQEQLEGLQAVIQSGQVRYVGLSNETPYGISQFVTLAQQYPDLYSKIISVQNSYSLVVRKDYEAGLSEMNYHHNVGLLAYSPLAGGSLTGKYRDKEKSVLQSSGSRLTLFPGFMDRYLGSMNEAAVNAYCDCAVKHSMTPTQLALAWCYQNELIASTIIGATTVQQLRENCLAYDLKRNIDETVLKDIDQIYKQYTDPTKARN